MDTTGYKNNKYCNNNKYSNDDISNINSDMWVSIHFWLQQEMLIFVRSFVRSMYV